MNESKGRSMFDPILVPLDGSFLAECVLPHIVAFTRSFKAQTTLLRMLEKNPSGTSVQLFDLLNWQIKKTESNLYLEKIKTILQESGVNARTDVLEGLVAEGIAEYAKNQDMKLIILSSHGKSGLSQWGISSIAQKIILSAPSSVLIIRAHQPEIQTMELPAIPLYQRILVPLDGSQRAENVLPVVTKLAHYYNSQIHLIQVIQPPEMARQMPPSREDIELSNRIIARNLEEAGQYLEQLKSRSYFEGLSVQTHLLTSDNAAAELHRVTAQENIDMVTLSAHGYSGNQQWPYGSMVNNFIMYCAVPLLIVQDLPGKQELIPLESTSRERADR
jgi:nucleotide-binding universal stress UspA family protein